MTITGANTSNFGFQKLGSNDAAGYSTINEVVDGIDTILNSSDRLIKASQTPTTAYVITGDGNDWVRGLVVTDSITNLAVTTGKINDGAVTSVKIAADVALSGNPTTTTQSAGNNTTRIATTGFVTMAISNAATSGGQIATGGIADNAVTLAKLATAVQALLVPTGTIAPFAGLAASKPTGWFVCDGSSFASNSLTTGMPLYDLLVAAGWSALPDLRGRTILGAGTGSGLTARALRDALGAETMPAHTHPINAWATTDGAGDHGHTVRVSEGGGGIVDGSDGLVRSSGIQDPSFGGPINGAGGHNHTIPATNTQSTGTGTHGVMQPSLVLNYIIKG
jgi:microcystin-dependent protein